MSYRGSRDSFGNGMTRGTTWDGVEVAKMNSVALRIPLLFQSLPGIFKNQGSGYSLREG